ncbi:MAG: patatin-like phospholipase family protein [Deinococcales bacterium]
MKVALVLGGGGARGLAHIGALKAFEEYDIQPTAISACSMGAIVGAFYAAGWTWEKLQDLTTSLKFQQFLHFGELGGLLGGAGIEKILSNHLPETFEELALPLSVTAVDVQAGNLVVFRSGELIPALRASSAIPGILSPVKHKGRYLIDGGLLNNLPVDIIRSMSLEPVIAVDIAAPPNRQLKFESEGISLLENLSALITGKRHPLDEILKRSLTIELFMKAFDIPQKVLTEMRLSMQPPELLIRPELAPQFGIEDFHRYEEAIQKGYEASQKTLRSWPYLSNIASGHSETR